MKPSDLASIRLDGKWFIIDDATLARAMEEQLGREVMPGHVLHGRKLEACLKSNRDDDVVYVEHVGNGADPVWWRVHLTWGRPVDARWPMAARLDAPDDLTEEGGDG